MLHPCEQVAFSDFQSCPTASWNSLIFQFSWPAPWHYNDPDASHFSLQNIPHLLSCILLTLCSDLCVHVSPCTRDWQYSWEHCSSCPGLFPGCELQSRLHNIPSTRRYRCCSSAAAQGSSCHPPLLARDICFPVQCCFALLLLYFVRARREIVSCQLVLGWWKAWSWETTQHLNFCLFCCLIVNLVYKVNESGEMGFLSLKRR